MKMATKDITVNGKVFSCPNDWTVNQAKTRIRSFYLLAGGGLRAGGRPLLGTKPIGETVGTLSFVGGKQIQQGKSAVFCYIYFTMHVHDSILFHGHHLESFN